MSHARIRQQVYSLNQTCIIASMYPDGREVVVKEVMVIVYKVVYGHSLGPCQSGAKCEQPQLNIHYYYCVPVQEGNNCERDNLSS